MNPESVTPSVLGNGIIEFQSQVKGPRIGIVCNIHGNETCGRQAVRRLLSKQTLQQGSLVIIDGNQEAALLDKRYVVSDMNRLFSEKDLASPNPTGDLVRAQYLANVIPSLGLDYAIDVHSTSAETGSPFTVSFPGSETISQYCPIPIIYGWQGIVSGTFVEWMNSIGIPTVGIEAGQHHAEKSIDVTERVLETLLHHYAVINLSNDFTEKEKSPVYTVLENFQVACSSSFAFAKPVRGFDLLEPGQLIASDRIRDYRAPDESGIYMLMPTLQANISNGISSSAYYLMKKSDD